MAGKNVELILPLSAAQNGLLLAYLRSDKSEGSITVVAELAGIIDRERFSNAWNATVRRHQALRSTAHWEGLEKPVTVIRKEIDAPVEFEPVSHESANDSIEIDKSPTSRLVIQSLNENNHKLIWHCHHMFLDGWSAGLVLGDLLNFYTHEDFEGEVADFSTIERVRNGLDVGKARQFWLSRIPNDFQASLIVGKDVRTKSSGGIVDAEEIQADKIGVFTGEHAVTPAAIIHGAWSTVLHTLLDRRVVMAGTVSSGRSLEVENIEKTAGMFATVQPFLFDAVEAAPISSKLKTLQIEMAKARGFDYYSSAELAEDSSLPSTLFDSLVVFENLPERKNTYGELDLNNFRSDIQSAYPITLVTIPTDERLLIKLIYDETVSDDLAQWLIRELSSVVNVILENPDALPEDLRTLSGEPPKESDADSEQRQIDTNEQLNQVENEIRLIWEDVLRTTISIEDDFFDVGGTSLNAVEIMNRLSEQYGSNYSPVLLISNPTIRSLSSALFDDDSSEAWSSVVPLRKSGKKPALFCLHGGGGHVMFYRPLAMALEAERPVYGIQPVGLEGDEEKLTSVEEMAAHYIAEVRKIQPEGPYHFLGYCFSSTVCVEIGKQLSEAGEKLGKVLVIDSPPMHMEVEVEQLPGIKEKVGSYVHLFRTGNWQELTYRFGYKFRQLGWKFEEVAGLDEKIIDPTLADAKEVLAKAYKDYEWSSFDFEVSLVLAGPIDVRPWAKVIIEQWRSLSNGHVHTEIIEADHATIFDSSTVSPLAQAIDRILE